MYPSWSPDGTKIAFQSRRDTNVEIYVMEADGSSPTNVTNHPSNDAWPSSPPPSSGPPTPPGAPTPTPRPVVTNCSSLPSPGDELGCWTFDPSIGKWDTGETIGVNVFLKEPLTNGTYALRYSTHNGKSDTYILAYTTIP